MAFAPHPAHIHRAGDQRQDRAVAARERLLQRPRAVGIAPEHHAAKAGQMLKRLGRQGAGGLHRRAAKGADLAGLLGRSFSPRTKAQQRRARQGGQAV